MLRYPNKETSYVTLGVVVFWGLFWMVMLWYMGQVSTATPPFITWHPGASSEVITDPSVEDRIRKIAYEYSYTDPDGLISLAQCESSLNPDAIGGQLQCFHGLYQWNTCIVDIITESCAHDIECSTATTIRALNRGEWSRWPVCLSQ